MKVIDDPLAREPIPYGYRVRFATSHHQGGWKKCAGLPHCQQCVRNANRRPDENTELEAA